MAKATILIVDDEASVRRILSKVFANEGYEVLSAAGGREAIGMAQERAVDVALVDLKMPDMGGIETIRRIKDINMGVSFIVITAFGEMDSVKSATELGVFDYITKPFDLDYVKNLVKHITEGVKPHTLPYSGDMKKILSGEITLEEAKRRKLESLKEDIQERASSLKDMSLYVDREISRYYSSSPASQALRHIKRICTNLYFIIIVAGIIVGVLFSYIYGVIANRNVYKRYLEKEERITISDFYRALSELRYWMRKHTEQGMRIEEEEEFNR